MYDYNNAFEVAERNRIAAIRALPEFARARALVDRECSLESIGNAVRAVGMWENPSFYSQLCREFCYS